MYFPYLYGRGSEILALRSILKDHRPLDNLVPVIEPVVADPARLAKCIEEYGKKGRAAVILLNPEKHELQKSADVKAWSKDVLAALKAAPTVLPGWRCTPSVSKTNVDAFINHFSGKNVALAYSSSSLDAAEIKALAGVPTVQYHLVIDDTLSAAKQALLPAGKRVDIRDRFKKLARNADYKGREFFSDRHSTYKGDEWVGFGDFLCLGNEFSAGGGPAAAVAVHACYKRTATEMWVEHFISDDTDLAVGTTASKFLQAAKKLVKAAKARPGEFGTNYALDEFAAHVAANHSPGLGKSKELQISHHLCVTLDVVNGVI
jgi:hypothetical protein